MKLTRINGELTVLGRNAAMRLLIDAEPKIKPHVYPKEKTRPEASNAPGKISLCYVRKTHPLR